MILATITFPLKVNLRNHEVNQVITWEPERIPSSPLEGIGFCPPAWGVIALSQLQNSKYFHWLYNSAVFPEKLRPSVCHPGIHRAPGSTHCEQSLSHKPKLETNGISVSTCIRSSWWPGNKPARKTLQSSSFEANRLVLLYFLSRTAQKHGKGGKECPSREGGGRIKWEDYLWGRDHLAFLFFLFCIMLKGIWVIIFLILFTKF